MKYEEAIKRIEYLKNKAEIALINNNTSCEWLKQDVSGTITAFSMAIDAIQKQATSNYTSEWVPVSERLPEGENQVLITVNGKFNNITFDNAVEKGFYCEDDGWIIDGYLDWITPDVTAWRALPEPYKGE